MFKRAFYSLLVPGMTAPALAKVDAAGRVELHTHLCENGVMKMRQVEK